MLTKVVKRFERFQISSHTQELGQFEYSIKPAAQLSWLGFRFGRTIIQPLQTISRRSDRGDDGLPVLHVAAVLNGIGATEDCREFDQEPAIAQLNVAIDAQRGPEQG